MKTTMKKTVIFLLIACLALSLAACRGPGNEPDTTNESAPFQSEAGPSDHGDTLPVSDPLESAKQGSETGAVSNTNTSSSTGPQAEPSKPVSTTAKPQAQVQKPSTKAEIVAYFNTAANKVKSEKPGMTKTEKISFQVHGDGMIASVANKVQDVLKKNGTLDPEPITVKKGASHNAAFPVENQSWASRLSADAVASAACVEKNGAFEITIRMKPERISYEQAKSPLQTKHGQVVDILKTSEIEEQMKSLSWLVTLHDLDQAYSGTTITCTVGKQSGKMRSAHYKIISNAAIKASALGIDAQVDATLTFDQHYQF